MLIYEIVIALVNIVFMMLTTILPLLVYQISNSVKEVGIILTIFMISMLVVRIVCLKKNFKLWKLLGIGS